MEGILVTVGKMRLGQISKRKVVSRNYPAYKHRPQMRRRKTIEVRTLVNITNNSRSFSQIDNSRIILLVPRATIYWPTSPDRQA